MCWCPQCSSFVCRCGNAERQASIPDNNPDKQSGSCDLCGRPNGNMDDYYKLDPIQQNLAGTRYGKEKIGDWCPKCGAFVVNGKAIFAGTELSLR